MNSSVVYIIIMIILGNSEGRFTFPLSFAIYSYRTSFFENGINFLIDGTSCIIRLILKIDIKSRIRSIFSKITFRPHIFYLRYEDPLDLRHKSETDYLGRLHGIFLYSMAKANEQIDE